MKDFNKKYFSLFFVFYKKGDVVCCERLVRDLQITRPTATKVLSRLYSNKKIKADYKFGDRTKWYEVL